VSSSTQRVERLVVGGGIGGLAAALAMARRGMAVHVIERAPAFEEIGAGIQLAPNASRVLDRLGILEAVEADAVKPPMATLMNAETGQRIAAIDFGKRFLKLYGYPYIVTHRTDLLNAILRQCQASPLVTLEADKEVVSVEDGDDSASVACADGTRYEARALVGADGIWSVVRRHIVGDGDPAYVGDVAYRGTIPTRAMPDRAATENLTWWIGPSMHLIQYPVRRRELLNQVIVFTAEGSSTGQDPQDWGPPEEIDARFQGKAEPVREAAKLIDRTRRWVLRDRAPVENWTRGRATLLGDAAHPMVQYLAQGACQAIEDAEALAQSLDSHRGDVRSALLAYQAARIPRTSAAQVWGRRMGEIVHADGLLAAVRDELLGGRDMGDFRYVDWLYGYRPGLGGNVLADTGKRGL